MGRGVSKAGDIEKARQNYEYANRRYSEAIRALNYINTRTAYDNAEWWRKQRELLMNDLDKLEKRRRKRKNNGDVPLF